MKIDMFLFAKNVDEKRDKYEQKNDKNQTINYKNNNDYIKY